MARDALATGNKPNLNPTEAEIQQYVYQTTYDKAYTQALNSSGFGTGGAIRQGIMAVSAAVQGLAGGNVAQAITGAATGELEARVIAERLYPGKAISEMTESEKQTVTTLSLLAGGLAAGTVGDSTTNAVAGAQASQNAVENNALSDIIENKVSDVSQKEKYQNA
ncbi:VENN motif pre-toxin domain-containing protein [Pectobacterium punjabense]|uniref:VENN motif pre-toxin domain-containing protein n=1 Tax=Pectobacterium punjabense TaxID=2108399 RepID=UPI003803260F